ncbi:putative WD domain G-beta repeat domain-containing protein [Phytophthora infestans]|uniref:Putative WD domain G-beta repeat domain-containing protein n=1 Tax=Phytophthora infestans TaxID=4787 RepID=A0A8S9V1S4_PHYIN|nr:putative WD domain G-beta repeat domain-containing protein [Phytophthora infestans]
MKCGVAEWAKLVQFNAKKRVVDSTKSRQAWNQWLVATRGTTVTPMIYEYGMAIASAKDRDKFMKACILPEETNRAGAAAESSVRDVVAALRQKWGTFMAASVVWSMWANDIIRSGNRSTWCTDIANPPPRYIANLLSPADSCL